MSKENLLGTVFRQGRTTYIPFPNFVLALSDQGSQTILSSFPEGDLQEILPGSENKGATPTSVQNSIKLAHLLSQEITKHPID